MAGLGLERRVSATGWVPAADFTRLPAAADLGVVLRTPSAGETSALLILVCGLWLAWRGSMDWRIPFAVMAGAVLTALPFWLYDSSFYPSPWFVLASGGLMLGAWFMASDMVASPVTPWGAVLYGVLIGVLTVVIRLFGGLAEGVMYAILIANAAGPLISDWTQPRIYGAVKQTGRK